MEIPYRHLVQIDCSKIQAEDGTYPLGRGRLSVFVEPLVLLPAYNLVEPLVIYDKAIFVAYFETPLEQMIHGQPTKLDATTPGLRDVLPEAFRQAFGSISEYEPRFDARALQIRTFDSFPLPGALNAVRTDQPLPEESLPALRNCPGRLSHKAFASIGCSKYYALHGASVSSALPKAEYFEFANVHCSKCLTDEHVPLSQFEDIWEIGACLPSDSGFEIWIKKSDLDALRFKDLQIWRIMT